MYWTHNCKIKDMFHTFKFTDLFDTNQKVQKLNYKIHHKNNLVNGNNKINLYLEFLQKKKIFI